MVTLRVEKVRLLQELVDRSLEFCGGLRINSQEHEKAGWSGLKNLELGDELRIRCDRFPGCLERETEMLGLHIFAQYLKDVI